MYRFLFFLLLPHLALAQKPGVIIDTLRCKNISSQSYALYLPSTYTSEKPHGVIIIFEPGGAGKVPVELYRDLADKYNIILACSNNSRNGSLDHSVFAGNTMLDDLLARFNIDKSFIITSGFSGGGRVSVQMAITRPGITGIIACGAAFPSPNSIVRSKTVPFAEVIGQLDMNYQEALTASAYLKSIENPSSLTYFFGGHQWPPVEAYEQALVWHLLRNKKLNASQAFANRMTLVKQQLDSGHVYETNRLLSQMRSDFDEQRQIESIDSALASLRKDKRLKSEMKEVGSSNSRELEMQKEFRTRYGQHMAYAAPDSAWHSEYWKSYRRECDKMIAGGGHKKLSGIRLIDYGWRMCSEQHFVFLEYAQYRNAAMGARIWAILTPNWVRPCVQAAKAFALQKRKSETMEYLRMAVARGLKDKESVRKDPAFVLFQNDTEFLSILK